MEVNYYTGNTYDQIMGLTIPSSSGYTETRINAGRVKNSGIEVNINATPLKIGDFSWRTILNFLTTNPS